MKKYISTRAKCPYYKHESRQVIDCTGVTDGTVLHLAFADATKSFNYKKTKCKQDYKDCPIYKMLKEQINNKPFS